MTLETYTPQPLAYYTDMALNALQHHIENDYRPADKIFMHPYDVRAACAAPRESHFGTASFILDRNHRPRMYGAALIPTLALKPAECIAFCAEDLNAVTYTAIKNTLGLRCEHRDVLHLLNSYSDTSATVTVSHMQHLMRSAGHGPDFLPENSIANIYRKTIPLRLLADYYRSTRMFVTGRS